MGLRSFFRKIDRAIRPVYKGAAQAAISTYGGPVFGQLGGAVLRGRSRSKRGGRNMGPGSGGAPRARPGQGLVFDPGGWDRPSVGTGGRPLVPAVVGGAVVVGRTAQGLFRAANVYCRKHPAWCAAAGGVPAVAQMVGDGRLPAPPKRKRKGISATDLQKFRRVASFLSKWGPVASKLPCKPRTGRKC